MIERDQPEMGRIGTEIREKKIHTPIVVQVAKRDKRASVFFYVYIFPEDWKIVAHHDYSLLLSTNLFGIESCEAKVPVVGKYDIRYELALLFAGKRATGN